MTGGDLLSFPERLLRVALRRLLSLWVQVQVFPEPLAITGDAPVCYVMPRPSVTDAAMLDALTRKHPVPASHDRCHCWPTLLGLRLHDDRSRDAANQLARLVDAVLSQRTGEVRLIPVSIFWGRAPEREEREDSPLRGIRLLRLWAAEGWGGRSRLRKLLSIIFYRRAVVAQSSGRPSRCTGDSRCQWRS